MVKIVSKLTGLKDHIAFIEQYYSEGMAYIEPFTNEDYRATVIPEERAMILCAPPRADLSGKISRFDHRSFWKWANALALANHLVFVAESSAPPDWVVVNEKPVKGKKAPDLLFYRATAYDEEAAREYYDPPAHKLYTVKQALKFVSIAARRDNSHLLIHRMRATASTATLTISAPVDIDVSTKPHAKTLSSAIAVVEEIAAPVAITMSETNKLEISSGKFQSFIECLSDDIDIQSILPRGVDARKPLAVFDAIQRAAPFMLTKNGYRPWVNSIFIDKNSCYATDNVIFVEAWHGSALTQTALLPPETVEVLASVGEIPTRLQISESTVTFWYHGERYVSSSLVDDEWPMQTVLPVLEYQSTPVPFVEDLFDNIKTLKPFVSDRKLVYLDDTGVRTHESKRTGTVIACETGITTPCIFKIESLLRLEEIAELIDWDVKSGFASFKNKTLLLRGVVRGLMA